MQIDSGDEAILEGRRFMLTGRKIRVTELC